MPQDSTRAGLLFDTSEFKEFLNLSAKKIISDTKGKGINEATIASIFEIKLSEIIREKFGLDFTPTKEEPISGLRHVATGKRDATGRIDSRIGALVIEYKHSSRLSTQKLQKEAVNQLVNYLRSLNEQNAHSYIGFVTDGLKATFITLGDQGQIKNEAVFEPLNERHLERILKTIILLNRSAFTPENLVNDFCRPIGNSLAEQLTGVFIRALETGITARSQMLFDEWKELFRLAHDDSSKQHPIKERRDALAAIVGKTIRDNESEYRTLYALQTTYAIIIKIIAYRFIELIRFNAKFVSFSELAIADSGKLRSQMYLLEEGAVFRAMGIGNLLEGDFFAWYCTEHQWNDEMASLVRQIFSILKDYEDAKLFSEYQEIRDLFKDLYVQVMPDKVRHSLGEYYTPEWLADDVISRALDEIKTKQWSALDPCSGSGTFVTALIKRVVTSAKEMPAAELLQSVLTRVKAIDLNPVAVLTTRINYFINVASLITDNVDFEIPVYLGDSSYVPEMRRIHGIDCVSYQLQTLRGSLDITLPRSAVADPHSFSKAMTSIELDIVNRDRASIASKILALTAVTDRKPWIILTIEKLADRFIELEENGWNGIWARIVTNFLTTANIGKFDLIVGNPPWIDWKNLPTGYRERIKSLCIDRNIFSGDAITGGINLNICALIANVAADNWLNQAGILAFLMPENLLFQQSYEGFRRFPLKKNGQSRLYFQKIVDWTASGHPFDPVQYPFLTYFLSHREQDYTKGIPVVSVVKKNTRKGGKLKDYSSKCRFEDVAPLFNIQRRVVGAVVPDKNMFTYADSLDQLCEFKKIAGESEYTGRDGVDFYPQELYMLSVINPNLRKGIALVKNVQNAKSKHKAAQQTFPIETKLLYPLVQSTDLGRFASPVPSLYVPFPYRQGSRSPIPIQELTKEAPGLMKYFNDNRHLFAAKTSYNKKIVGAKHFSEYYALTRVGAYSYADCYVAFRKDTKWLAAVVQSVDTPWGERKVPKFQSHAVAMCERSDGTFIVLEEAHYICAILNSNIVTEYILNSSDKRSFKVRPPIRIPRFIQNNHDHKRLSMLSIKAHAHNGDLKVVNEISSEIDQLVLRL